jgi:putative transposase
MIDHHRRDLSVRRQCELLSLSRSGLYYEPEPTDPEELGLMRRIDELHLAYPFYGSRKLGEVLRGEGREANRKRVQRLMRVMGLEAMVPKPKTSEPHPEHVVFPYLLRGLRIHRVNQVWATDITYIPMKSGFAYLIAIMDWHSRRVLSWRLSNTMDASFCVEALEEALARFGKPEIFNTDQGAQFTAETFTQVLRIPSASDVRPRIARSRYARGRRSRWTTRRKKRGDGGISGVKRTRDPRSPSTRSRARAFRGLLVSGGSPYVDSCTGGSG